MCIWGFQELNSVSKALWVCSAKTTEKERVKQGKGQLRDTYKLFCWLFSAKKGCGGKKVSDDVVVEALRGNWSLGKLLRKINAQGMTNCSGVQGLSIGTLPTKSESVMFHLVECSPDVVFVWGGTHVKNSNWSWTRSWSNRRWAIPGVDHTCCLRGSHCHGISVDWSRI